MNVSRRQLLQFSGAGALAAGVATVVPGGTAVADAATRPSSTSLAGDVDTGPVVQPGSAAAIARARKLVAKMTLDEKIAYTSGQPAAAGFTGFIPANTRLNIPALRLADGPSGVGNGSTGVTQWPDSKTLAATWNPDTAAAYGTAYGAEQAGKGHNVALAPCINIIRQSFWGRSYETYTEDPYLNGRLAAATIRGIQSNHVVATVKHFAAYNQEILRSSIDVIVSPRALQEIYYPGFRAAIQQGGAAAVMTSYNKINGTWASENRVNEQDVLRDTWGFDGMNMSDWYGTHSTVQTAKAGTDIEMPGGPYVEFLGTALKAAIQSGEVSETQLDDMVTHVLTGMIRVGLLDHPLPDPATVLSKVVSTRAHLDLARQIAIEGSVLLKNDDDILPLGKPKSIAVIGDAASAGVQSQDGGPGLVIPNGTIVTPLAGIKARAGSIPVTYTQGTLGVLAVPTVPASAFGGGLTATYFASTDLSGTALATQIVPNIALTATPAPVAAEADGWSARYTGTFTAPSTGGYRFSLTGVGTATLTIDGHLVLTYLAGRETVQNGFIQLTAGAHDIIVTYLALPVEGRPPTASLTLGYQAGYDTLHQQAAAAAKKAAVAVVVVADVTGEGMDRSTLALPADQDDLIAAVAKANPNTIVVLNTSGAVTMPWLGQVKGVIANWYSGQELGNAVAAMLFGDDEPGGRLPETFPATDKQGPAKTTVEFPGDGVQVYYDEGLAVGYRWYESSGERPLFPFGYGLSYTSFLMTDLKVSTTKQGLQASVKVTNTGRRTGTEVVQLYITDPSGAGEPAQRLKAFAKLTLDKGKSKSITLTVSREELAVWLNSNVGWTVLPGVYTIGVGNSSAHLPLREQLKIS